MLVNPAIVHDNNGLGCWKRLHLVQKSADKTVEHGSVEGSFNNLAMNDSVVEGKGWKNRVSNDKRKFCS